MNPTKEEILSKYLGSQSISMEGKKHKRVYFDDALKAMQKYAEQFHKEKLREEIITAMNWIYSNMDIEMASMEVEEQVSEYIKTKE